MTRQQPSSTYSELLSTQREKKNEQMRSHGKTEEVSELCLFQIIVWNDRTECIWKSQPMRLQRRQSVNGQVVTRKQQPVEIWTQLDMLCSRMIEIRFIASNSQSNNPSLHWKNENLTWLLVILCVVTDHLSASAAVLHRLKIDSIGHLLNRRGGGGE